MAALSSRVEGNNVESSSWLVVPLSFLLKMKKTPALAVGFGLVGIFLIVAAAADVIGTKDPLSQDYDNILSSPSRSNLLGTDDLGRDTYSRTVHATRIALRVSVGAVFIAVVVGVTAGLSAGFYRGLLEHVILTLSDSIYAFPTILLGMALVSATGPGVFTVTVAIGLSLTPVFVRLMRAQVLSLRETDYVMAARSMGATNIGIILRHMLPNALAPIIVQASLAMAFAVLAEAGLSFLGIGVNPPTATWGGMLRRGVPFLSEEPWMAFVPGTAILFLSLGLNLLGDGLRDVMDPRLRGSR